MPALGTTVKLEPVALPGYAFRHCYSQGFVTPTAGSGYDHAFVVRAALSGAGGSYSFESKNFPGSFLAISDGRAGIVNAPPSRIASWTVQAASGGGLNLALDAGGALGVGSNLTGTCAHSYSAPSASVYLVLPSAATAWNVSVDTEGPAYPPRADCVILKIYGALRARCTCTPLARMFQPTAAPPLTLTPARTHTVFGANRPERQWQPHAARHARHKQPRLR
jgi:hypothetical protein